ncbi:hypothetical protein R0J91_14670, partial [Micrococcus sp. SIMBA_131]
RLSHKYSLSSKPILSNLHLISILSISEINFSGFSVKKKTAKLPFKSAVTVYIDTASIENEQNNRYRSLK